MPNPIAGLRQPPLIGYASITQLPKETDKKKRFRVYSLANLIFSSIEIRKERTSKKEHSISIKIAYPIKSLLPYSPPLMNISPPDLVAMKERSDPMKAPPNCAIM